MNFSSMDDVVSNATHVERVKSEHEKGLVSCLQKIRQWKKYKDDYEALHDRLKTLPDKLAYDIMVPFGSHAFMPGTMVHTNKITVLLGDNWFADVSAKQASEIAQRRIKQCEKMLEDLEKEKQQFENWLGYISEVTNQELVEIKEEYDPEKEKLWREQHSKNVKEHRKKIAEERKNEVSEEKEEEEEESSPQVQTLENYFSRFDSDDEEEEEDDITSSEEEEEDMSMNNRNDNDGNESNHNIQQNASLDNEKPVDVSEKINLDAVVEEDQDTETEPSPIRNDNDPLCNNNEKRHVHWIDLSEAKSRRITFTHSTSKSNNNNPKKKHRRRRKSSSTSEVEEEDADPNALLQINSPSDIYKRFSFSMQLSKPKSILKSTPSSSPSNDSHFPLSDSASNDTQFSFSNSASNDSKPVILSRSDKKKRPSKGNIRTEHSNFINKGACHAEAHVSGRHAKADRKGEAKRNFSKEVVVCDSDTKKKGVSGSIPSVVERTVESVSADTVPMGVSLSESCSQDEQTAPVSWTLLDSSDDKSEEVKLHAQEPTINEVEEGKNALFRKQSIGDHERNDITLNVKEANGISDDVPSVQNMNEKAFTGEVCERTTTNAAPAADSQAKPRPKSLFKSVRSGARV